MSGTGSRRPLRGPKFESSGAVIAPVSPEAPHAVPTYEYRCPAGHHFEHFVPRISDGTSTHPCPTCGVSADRRISAGGGLLFKGSGFYITDYGKDGKKDQRAVKPAASGTGAAESGDTAAKNTSGEAKPAGDASKAGATGASGAAPAGGKSDA